MGAGISVGYSREISMVHSHWSRNVEAHLSLVESFPSDACAIKNQLGHPKPPTRVFGTQNTPIGGYFACSSLVLYVIRIVGFHARKGPIIGALMP